ncbi:hypothetical protein [Aquimarina algiphila]|uniref:hypothetical protein n=1 Tax=Aquimarina algiphila TaxID=2047982 RepID=UPI002491436A|nr:hypothetical protein [Aquimarina algiphila]
MKTYLLILFFALSTLSCFSQKMTFNVDFSKNYATLDFLNNLSPNYPSNPYKEVFKNSKYDTKKYRDLIDHFAKINIFYQYEYPQYPYGNKIGGNTYFILGRNLIESKDLNEFKRKSFGIIPNHDLNKLYEILLEFQPIYDELVFEPCRLKFNQQIEKTRELISKVDIDKLFKQTIKFHESNWDFSIPFKLSMYPIPNARKRGFNATAFYNIAIAGIPQGFEDFEELLAVLFHESSHIVYDEQSLSVKKDIESWFKNNSSKSSNYAQLLFNEAITTSIANGYLYQELTGKLPEGNWYRNKFISNMAQKIYPLVEKYFDKNRTIDQDFINEYIAVFDKEFPSWMEDIDFVLMQRFAISENKEAYKKLLKNHRYSNINEYEYKLDALTIEKMKTHPITKIILVTDKNQHKLDLIKESFEELKEWKPDVSFEFTYIKFLKDKTYLIIINSHSEDISMLMESLSFQ